jgi:hypothetical protein
MSVLWLIGRFNQALTSRANVDRAGAHGIARRERVGQRVVKLPFAMSLVVARFGDLKDQSGSHVNDPKTMPLRTRTPAAPR